MKIGIIIPARYGSKRLQGKPLKKIGTQTMLQRVVAAAKKSQVPVHVATDDRRIFDHCLEIGVEPVMTDEGCPTGTDRVYQAALRLGLDFALNLQGDVPFIPPEVIHAMIQTVQDNPAIEMITPALRLSWDDLEQFRNHKKISPSSGTTVVVDKEGYACWFSKQILPFIRHEKDLKECPVLKHVGMYGYSINLLKRYTAWPEGFYEKIEGLEQLRAVENGVKIKVIPLSLTGDWAFGGIDTEEDLEKACLMVTEKQKSL